MWRCAARYAARWTPAHRALFALADRDRRDRPRAAVSRLDVAGRLYPRRGADCAEIAGLRDRTPCGVRGNRAIALSRGVSIRESGRAGGSGARYQSVLASVRCDAAFVAAAVHLCKGDVLRRLAGGAWGSYRTWRYAR